MNDVADHDFNMIPDDHPLRRRSNIKLEQRSDRRATALNAVDLARVHAGREHEPYSQSEADTIMAIMELLDRLAIE